MVGRIEAYNEGRFRVNGGLGPRLRGDDRAVGECGWGLADKMKLCQWAYTRFEMSLEAEELNEENAREIIERGARQFLRSELTELERYVLLQIYDATWKDHLYAMDHLKSSVGLRDAKTHNSFKFSFIGPFSHHKIHKDKFI